MSETVAKGPIWSTQAAHRAAEIRKASFMRAQEWAAGGGLVAWCTRGVAAEILSSMDIYPLYPEAYAASCASQGVQGPFISRAESQGFSTDICSVMRIFLGLAAEIGRGKGLPEGAPFGGLPKPDILLCSSFSCDARPMISKAMELYLDVPIYSYDHIEPPTDDLDRVERSSHEHYIQYNVQQIQGLVRFLEGQTGKKLDMKRLSMAVRHSIETWRLMHQIFQLRKNVPAPMPSEDFMACTFPWFWMPGQAATMEFYQELYDELKARVHNGVSVIPEERFRLLWVGTGLYFDMGLFNHLESRGAVSVVETVAYPSTPVPINMSDPVRALAECYFWGSGWGGADGSQIQCGPVGGNVVLELVREYQVDGVIVFSLDFPYQSIKSRS